MQVLYNMQKFLENKTEERIASDILFTHYQNYFGKRTERNHLFLLFTWLKSSRQIIENKLIGNIFIRTIAQCY